jgi:hypothetical protein
MEKNQNQDRNNGKQSNQPNDPDRNANAPKNESNHDGTRTGNNSYKGPENSNENASDRNANVPRIENNNDNRTGNNTNREPADTNENTSGRTNTTANVRQPSDENPGKRNDIGGARNYNSQSPEIDSTTTPPVGERNNSFDGQKKEAGIDNAYPESDLDKRSDVDNEQENEEDIDRP